MSITSLGDLANAFVMRRQSAESKSQIQRLSTELTTGVAQDTAAHLAGNLTALSGIETSLTKAVGYRSAAVDLGLSAGAMQIALNTIAEQSQTLSGTLLAASTSSSQLRLDTVAVDAEQRLGTVVSMLNTRFGDQTLFAGTKPNQPAMVSASALLDQLQVVVAGAIGAQEAEDLVAAWFDDPAGFAASAYLGGDAAALIGVAPGETAALNVTALNPAIKDMLKALSLPALMTRGLLAGQPAAQADIAKRSGERLLEVQSDWVDMSSRLGTTEAQLQAAITRNSAESSALEIARADLIGLDPFDTATRLEAAQTQLETLYALTARMQRLHLSEYL